MTRTEDDLRTVYADQPGADEVERQVLDWLRRSGHVDSSTRRSWAAAWAVAALVAALIFGAVALLPRVAQPSGAPAAATPAASEAQSTYYFGGFTKPGSVIAAGQRKLAGPLSGLLLGGGDYSLAADAGHVVVLEFFATWCGPCQLQVPAFEALSRRDGPDAVKFVGVDVKDGTVSASRDWLAANRITFPVVWDQGSGATAVLGLIPIVGLPVTVVIDKDQRVAAVYEGMFATSELSGVVDSLSRSRP